MAINSKLLFWTGTKVFQLGLGTFVSYSGALEAGPPGGLRCAAPPPTLLSPTSWWVSSCFLATEASEESHSADAQDSFMRFNVYFLCPDVRTSQWGVQVDVIVDAAQDTNMLIVLSVPELDSEQSFQTRFLQGKSKNSLTLNINKVTSPVVWMSR